MATQATPAPGKAKSMFNGGDDPSRFDYEPSPEIQRLLESKGLSVVPQTTNVGPHGIGWSGKNFNLPATPRPLTLEESAQALLEKAREENQTIQVSEPIDALPWDGAQALYKAVDALYGFSVLKATPGFFGPQPPVMRTIKTGPKPGDTLQVFWGRLYVARMEWNLQTEIAQHRGRLVFKVGGEIKKKDQREFDRLITLARHFAEEFSIYKGKAIALPIDSDDEIDFGEEPRFIDTSKISESDLIFSDSLQAQIDTNLFTPVRHSDACRKVGIPLKRSIMLAGPYGCGKSLTAALTAKIAQQNGWTFMLVPRAHALAEALRFAPRYAPVIIFAEDADTALEGERDDQMNDLLNTLDGAELKGVDIITVLTTNFPEKLNKAMVRPGRLDAIITVTPPDAGAAEKLMRNYGRGLIKPGEKLARAKVAVAGRIPAVIREVVERAKLSAITRTQGVPDGVTDDDLVVAYDTMKGHLDLLDEPTDKTLTPEETLGKAFGDIIAKHLDTDGLENTVDHINGVAHVNLEETRRVKQSVQSTEKMMATVAEKADGAIRDVGNKIVANVTAAVVAAKR